MAAELTQVITVCSIGVAIIVAFITGKMTSTRDGITAQRTILGEKIKETKALYTETASFLDYHISHGGLLDDEHGKDLKRVSSLIKISGGEEVVKGFKDTTEIIDKWTDEISKSQYQTMGGNIIIRSGGKEQEHKKAAEAILPEVSTAFENLQKMMRDHITELEDRLARLNTGKK